MNPLLESLIKANHDINFVCDDLQSASGAANELATIILIDLCERANKLATDIYALRNAVEENEE